MFKRILISIKEQKIRSILFCVVAGILFMCLSVIYIMDTVSDNLKTSMMNSINPTLIIDTPMTVQEREEFVFQTAIGSIDDAKIIYQDMLNLFERSKTLSYSLNFITNGCIFMLPQVEDYLLFQPGVTRVDLIDESVVLETHASFSRIKNGMTIAGGNHTRLASHNSETLNPLYCDEVCKMMGRSFTTEELDGGDNVIVLGKNGFYIDGEGHINEVNVGDTISYNLYIKAESGRNIAKSYAFEVIGIIEDHKQYDVNFIPEKTFKHIMQEVYPLVYEELPENKAMFSLLQSVAKLDSLDSLFKFDELINELKNQGKDYSYISDVEDYSALYGEMEGVGSSFDSLFIFAFGSVCLTLFCLMGIEVNRRKREIGTWLSLGLKAKNVAISFMFEYWILFLLGFVLALFLAFVLVDNLLPIFLDLTYLDMHFDFLITDYFKLQDMFNLILIVIVVLFIALSWSFYRISHFSIKELTNE